MASVPNPCVGPGAEERILEPPSPFCYRSDTGMYYVDEAAYIGLEFIQECCITDPSNVETLRANGAPTP